MPNAPGAIMLSAFTSDGARSTMEALRRGAFDFVLKPKTNSPAESMHALRSALTPLIHEYRRVSSEPYVTAVAECAARATRRRPGSAHSLAAVDAAVDSPGADVVAIGISTGGPDALARMVPSSSG